MGTFSGLRKKLSSKDYKKMFDALENAEKEGKSWTTDVDKFLNSGKMPSKTAADIDKIISDAEKLALENQKKLKSKDSRSDVMSNAITAVQKLKIDHRKHVGTVLSSFEGLDASGAKQVSAAAKLAIKKVEETKSAADAAIQDVFAIVQRGIKEAKEPILKNAGYAHSQRQYTEDTGKLLGRTVKSKIDYSEFKAALDRASNIEKLNKNLDLVLKMIKKV
jgi:hypothetical protein